METGIICDFKPLITSVFLVAKERFELSHLPARRFECRVSTSSTIWPIETQINARIEKVLRTGIEPASPKGHLIESQVANTITANRSI